MSSQQLERVSSPFAAPARDAGMPEVGALAVSQGREIAEVKAAVAMARQFPRDQRAASNRILDAFTRLTLAESALYAYKRGSEIVSGPSIRAAEAIAREWGNLNFGVRELEQANGASTMEAYCWDLETNVRSSKVFVVKHERKAQGKVKSLDDPRDVYELAANMGARRMRACILAIIPSDVVESAVKQAEVTITHQSGAPEEQIATMLEAFESFGITREHVAKRLGHAPEKSKAAEILNLRRIYVSIRDGISKPSEFFDVTEAPAKAEQVSSLETTILARETPPQPKAAPVAKGKAEAPAEKAGEGAQ